tara:strand:+ start:2146 stop:2268 length:123 start_codon:yes stop_codon:yes gene_type:complete
MRAVLETRPSIYDMRQFLFDIPAPGVLLVDFISLLYIAIP